VTGQLDPETLRPDFPVLQRTVHGGTPLVYFDNAATTQRPEAVIEAVAEVYREYYANVGRSTHALAAETTARVEDVREKVARFLGAPSSQQIVFTAGATAGINLVARSWGDANVREGDEILLTQMEHHSNLVPWHQLARRSGASIRYIPVTDDGLLELDALDALLTERTKLVSVTAVSNVLGTINPLEEIISRAHDAGAVVLVDGAQSVPHQATDVAALDADFLAFSGHKMLGPTGVGVLYGKPEQLEAMPPFLGGGGMITEVTLEGFEPNDVPERFEAGTLPIAPIIGLGAAIDYLEGIGLERIARHERRLTRRIHEVLEAAGDVRILGPDPDRKAGIVSFTLDGHAALDVAELLDGYGVAVRAGHHCAMPLHKRFGVPATARASFYFYNTLAEIDRFAEALDKVRRMLKRHR